MNIKDMKCETLVSGPRVAEIVDMLFNARRTIEAQDRLIESLENEKHALGDELKLLLDEYYALEEDYKILEQINERLRG